MIRQIKIGLVGIGDIAHVHARALHRVPGVKLAIVQGRNPEKARALAAEVDAEIVENYEALLRDDSIDGVDLCVPNDLHRDYAVAAARAGKATLCEKPIALKLSDAEEMVAAFEVSATPLVVAHVLRFWPEYVKGRELMVDGSIGTVRSFSARRMLPLLLAVSGTNDWRRAASRSGGAVIDLQIHDLDYILWLFGKPRSVFSRGVRSEYGSFDHVNTILDYGSDLVVSVESSFMLKGNPVVIDYRAIGDTGSLEFSYIESDFAMHDMHLDRAVEKPRNQPSLVRYQWGCKAEIVEEQTEDPISTAFQCEMMAFVELLRGTNNASLPRPQDAVDALRLALASQRSCETGQPVSFQ